MRKRQREAIRRNVLWEEAAEFCRTRLATAAPDGTAGSEFPLLAFKCCGEFRLQGLCVPEEYGGRGLSCADAATVLEAFGYAWPDNGLLASVVAQFTGCVVPVWKWGTEEQRQRFLPALCSGALVAAHAATEPDAGSDLFSLKTTASPTARGYVLNGRKTYVLNALAADVVLVMATTKPDRPQEGLTAFLVERGTSGMSVTRRIEKVGLRGAELAELTFEGCEVPAENRLGAIGSGMMLFHTAMLWERTFVMSPHVGTMQRVLERCVAYAKARQQFGQSIGKFQSVSNRIADMKVRGVASRRLLAAAATAIDEGTRDLMDASIAKLFASEAAVETYLDAIRIHGAYGYTEEAEFAADLRDAVATVIVAGTSDIQRAIIARHLGL